MVEQIVKDVKVNHSNNLGCPVIDTWQPTQIVDVGCGCNLGIATDDGCFVVLYPTEMGQWRLGAHIPLQVAKVIGELAETTGDCI
ncbi:hypothetical protein ES703_83070 [subsurface metagenome]